MKRIDLAIPGPCILEPVVHGDHRGFFCETYNERTYAGLGITHRFVQDNHSRSTRGVLRGLHWQIQQPQAKLVRVIEGEVFDIAVDIRRGSPTFGHWVGEVLSEANRRMLFVPEGFAHGFLVLSETAEFLYKVSDLWCPAGERGIRFDDPDVAIAWPGLPTAPTLSKRDDAWGKLRDLPADALFTWNPANPQGI
jgi:dTDP-4-dehydrorhamnose 3,5-epimerase